MADMTGDEFRKMIGLDREQNVFEEGFFEDGEDVVPMEDFIKMIQERMRNDGLGNGFMLAINPNNHSMTLVFKEAVDQFTFEIEDVPAFSSLIASTAKQLVTAHVKKYISELGGGDISALLRHMRGEKPEEGDEKI